MNDARRRWLAAIALMLLVGTATWLLLDTYGGLGQLGSKPTGNAEAERAAHDPRNLPIGRYVFKTPEGVIAGRTRLGGVQTRIVLFDDTVKWRERSDADGGLPEDRYSLQVLIDPITERYGNSPRRPANDTSVTTKENVLAFEDNLLYLRPLWLKDARGDYSEFTCGPRLFDRLVETNSITSLDETSCRFRFRPREDITVMIQTVPGARLPQFLPRIKDIYNLISDAIEIEP